MDADRTPILVGAGQFTERLDSPSYRGLGPVEIAAAAVSAAAEDTGVLQLLDAVDFIATTRTFEDSSPAEPAFGRINNFPRALCSRLGITPKTAKWSKAGGNSPQQLVNDTAEKLAAGVCEVALIAGAEAISTVRHLQKLGETRDWSDDSAGQVDNEGWGLAGMLTQYAMAHGLTSAPPTYALFEHARQAATKLTNHDYAQRMGELFENFTKVAAANPYSSTAQQPRTAEELAFPTEGNRMIASPYPQRLVARDQVNQGAALFMTTVARAREMGIAQDRWVFLHGYSSLAERSILERADLGRSPAACLAVDAALEAAHKRVDEIRYFDFYSCFPVAVFNVAIDHLGLQADDPRGLTVTGGLPYFGGPGNNYSMHAIASMVTLLRGNPGSFGLIGANGGMLSKYAAGVYSTQPAAWNRCDSTPLQQRIDALAAPATTYTPQGTAAIETFTLVHEKGEPAFGMVVGRQHSDGARFFATTTEASALQALQDDGVVGRSIHVAHTPRGNRFSFDRQPAAGPDTPPPDLHSGRYGDFLLARHGQVLEIAIDRPERGNCLDPQASEALDRIVTAFEQDPALRAAVLTGAGGKAFCNGTDLQHVAKGKPNWLPHNGFGGLTERPVRSKPIVAAVVGSALDMGLELCLACDILVVDEGAELALSQVRHGTVAQNGGIRRLLEQLPDKLATELVLTGARLDAHRAHAFGLVNHVLPRDGVLEHARQVAAQIAANAPLTVSLSLQIARAHGLQPGAQLPTPAAIGDALATSEDYYEGLKSRLLRRPAQWTGR